MLEKEKIKINKNHYYFIIILIRETVRRKKWNFGQLKSSEMC